MHPSKDIKGSEGKELENQNIVLCITGSVAAIKCIELTRKLMRQGGEVRVVMSRDATEFITPQLMHWASGNPVTSELTGNVEHIDLAKWGDIIIVAPSTANTISKIAYGVEDTAVTSIVSVAQGLKKPVIIVPAMHKSMYSRKIIQENISKLRDLGIEVLDAEIEEDKAKIPEVEEMINLVKNLIHPKDLDGKKILVTAGPTLEKIDQVMIITNKSSGKMGIEIARAAAARGGEVTLIYGSGTEKTPSMVDTIRVESTSEMKESVFKELESNYELFISAAAPQDFMVEKISNEKIRHTQQLNVKLIPAPRILDEAREKSPGTFLIGFKAEYNVTDEELEKAALKKMKESKLDMVVANDVSRPESGFESSKNDVLILSKKKQRHVKSTKSDIADIILDMAIRELEVGK